MVQLAKWPSDIEENWNVKSSQMITETDKKWRPFGSRKLNIYWVLDGFSFM